MKMGIVFFFNKVNWLILPQLKCKLGRDEAISNNANTPVRAHSLYSLFDESSDKKKWNIGNESL